MISTMPNLQNSGVWRARGPRILVASASAGTGHLRAAEAVRESLIAALEGAVVEHVDVLRLGPRWLRTAYGSGFELMAARAPWLWRELYRVTDGPGEDSARWGPVAERVLFRAFHRLLGEGSWDACVATHFLPAQLAAGLPGMPPFALAVTDFTLHRYWVQPRVRHYFVAMEAMAGELRRRLGGVSVEATGIPIAPDFGRAPGRAEARAELGLPQDRPVALIMGGGCGIGIEASTHAALGAGVDHVQLVVACGKNEAARVRLEALGHPPDRLRVLGYTRGVERYLSAADVVVTKPGGLTTSEALALGRPLLLTRAIPGHEEGNTRAIVRTGAALPAGTAAELTIALRKALLEPGVLEAMARCAETLGRPHAAAHVAASVLQHLAAREPARLAG